MPAGSLTLGSRARNRPAKRKYKKKKKDYGNKYASTVVMKNPTGMADRTLLKMKYVERVSLADGVGGVGAIQVYRANSVYDPDYTGTGAQPLSLDQWANFYNYYKVLGCKIDVKAFPLTSTVANANCILAIVPTPTIMTVTTDTITASQMPYAKTFFVGPANGGVIGHASQYMSTKKIFGKKDVDDEEYKALLSASPQNAWYYNIIADAVDGLSTFDIDLIVTVTYYIELTERVVLAQS